MTNHHLPPRHEIRIISKFIFVNLEITHQRFKFAFMEFDFYGGQIVAAFLLWSENRSPQQCSMMAKPQLGWGLMGNSRLRICMHARVQMDLSLFFSFLSRFSVRYLLFRSAIRTGTIIMHRLTH